MAHGTRIDGNVLFGEGMRIDGEVVGDIRSGTEQPSILVISESARVEGAVHADHVIVNGSVTGPVHAAELLELQPKARITGNVHYKALEMHQGAMITGQMCPLAAVADEKPHCSCRQSRRPLNPRLLCSSIGSKPENRSSPMSAVAENIQTEMPAPILFTDSAAAKVADLIAEEGNPDLKLRVFVQGGGCSGFQYGFTFDEITNDDDTTMTKNGVSLLIDAMSYQYLVGAEIDYKEDLQGAQFVIKNPNATTTCGCGSSFSA